MFVEFSPAVRPTFEQQVDDYIELLVIASSLIDFFLLVS